MTPDELFSATLRPHDESLESLLNRFVRGWLEGDRPMLPEFLAAATPAERDQLLVELIHAELELRLKAGESARVEEYVARFPTLAVQKDELCSLVHLEYRQRRRTESAVDGTEYLHRFPNLALDLERWATEEDHRSTPIGSPPSTGAAGVALPGYEVLGELGRGGMGVVYKARQLRPGRLVALKLLSDGSATEVEHARFRGEAEAVARLQHPGIVQIFEVGESTGGPFFSLELVTGGNLAQKLAATPQEPRWAAGLVRELALAVQAAHAAGVLHRDLKPANVLLTEDGRPKVTDFGLAKRIDDDSGRTRTGQILGTPSYMAPEQAVGKVKEIGPGADIYGLGAILYECLTGRPPFKGATVFETIEQVVSRDPVSVRLLQPSTPRDLETICLKCLHKDPARRYGSAAALADDLGRWQAGEPIAARPVGRLERGWRWCRRNPLTASLLTLIVLGFFISAAWITWQGEQNRTEKLRAEGNLDMAYKVLDELYLDQVGKRFQDQRELSADDRRFLERLLAFYQQFAEGNSRLPATRWQMGKAYRRVSTIQFILGNYESAREGNEQSVRLLEQLVEEFPKVAEYRQDLVQSQIGRGHALLLSGRIRDAEQAYAWVVAFGEKLLKRASDDPEASYTIAAASLNLANPATLTGDVRQAEEVSRRAIRLFEDLAAAFPGEVKYLNPWQIALMNLSEVVVDGHRLEAVEQTNDEMLRVLELGRPFPEMKQNDDIPRVFLHAGRAFALRLRGRFKEAEDHLRQALTLMEPLIAKHPTAPDFAPRVAELRLELSLVLQAAGKSEEALTWACEASAPAAVMIGKSPLPYYPAQLARVHLQLGMLLRAGGQKAEAEKSYAQARQLLEKVVKDFPDRATDQSNLGTVLDRQAELLLDNGLQAKALPLLKQAAGHHALAQKLSPDHLLYRRYLDHHVRLVGLAEKTPILPSDKRSP